MAAPFDIDELIKDLAAFRDSVSFHLTDERPVPPDLAEQLWSAHDVVASVLEELKRRYDATEGGWAIYAPEGSSEREP